MKIFLLSALISTSALASNTTKICSTLGELFEVDHSLPAPSQVYVGIDSEQRSCEVLIGIYEGSCEFRIKSGTTPSHGAYFTHSGASWKLQLLDLTPSQMNIAGVRNELNSQGVLVSRRAKETFSIQSNNDSVSFSVLTKSGLRLQRTERDLNCTILSAQPHRP